ncbi:hypothetical protein [uncultured Secundilactobacillus sp.]|nr:hypothetical protein [uncultured Secundilactobacillus sp.]
MERFLAEILEELQEIKKTLKAIENNNERSNDTVLNKNVYAKDEN